MKKENWINKGKRLITREEAMRVWQEVKDNEFVLMYYPTFEDYWRECERINNLPEDEWQELMKENQRKLEELNKLTDEKKVAKIIKEL
jgi:hypothetical protein